MCEIKMLKAGIGSYHHMPLDVVKSRLAIFPTDVRSVVVDIYQKQGIQGFYKGLGMLSYSS